MVRNGTVKVVWNLGLIRKEFGFEYVRIMRKVNILDLLILKEHN